MTIFVGVDGSPGGFAALRWALREGKARGELVEVVTAWRPPLPAPALGTASMDAEVERVRAEVSDEVTAQVEQALAEVSDVEVRSTTVEGHPASALLDRQDEATLIVVGARHTSGLVGALLGSVADSVVSHAHVPVVVIPETGDSGPGPIVVGMDGSEHAGRALRWAVEAASFRKAPVQAVLSWSYLDQHHPDGRGFDPHYNDDTARAELQEMIDRALGDGATGERPEAVTVCDLAAAGLLSAAKACGASLVVVGARGLGGFRELLLGSVTRKVLAHTDRPVAVIRPGWDG